MERAQWRASLRVIKSSSRLNRQPKIKPAKAVKNNYSNFAAAAVLAVTLVLLGLSLSHLAAGIALVTGAGPSESWLMAIGIDLGFIALELAVLAAPAEKRAAVVRYAAPAIGWNPDRIGRDERLGVRRACRRFFDLSGDRARAGNPGADFML